MLTGKVQRVDFSTRLRLRGGRLNLVDPADLNAKIANRYREFVPVCRSGMNSNRQFRFSNNLTTALLFGSTAL
jgi:hypothetical protein